MPVAARTGRAEQRRREAHLCSSSRSSPAAPAHGAGCCRAASGRCWRSPSALVCQPELLLVDELSLGLAPVVVADLLQRLLARSAARACPDAGDRGAERGGRAQACRPRLCAWRTAASCSTAAPRASPSHPDVAGVLPRPVEPRGHAPQLSRRQAIPPQSEVVWLAAPIEDLEPCASAGSPCSMAFRWRSSRPSCWR